MFFFGSIRVKLDEKNRLRMPARFAAAITDNALIMRGTQNSLFVMSEVNMEKLWESIYSAPISDFAAQDTLRLLNSGTYEIEADAQNRFVVPSNLKVYACIDKNLVLVGMKDRIEIWSEELFDKKFGVAEDTIDNAVAGLKDRYRI